MYFYSPCERLIFPLAIAVKATPVIAIAPIIAIWCGPGELTKILMSTLVSFFPVLQGLHDGLREVPEGPKAYVAVIGTTPLRDLYYVRSWYALRPLASALKIAAPLAVVGALVAEFVQPTAGLGTLLVRHIPSADTEVIFAAIACVATIGLSMYGATALLADRLLSIAHLERNVIEHHG
jgi:ABC-type nitrate/sulfonate/bicarbonate transport system permease component